MPKRSIKRDKLHLLNIRDSIERIEEYLKRGSRNGFNDELIFDGVVMQLTVIAGRLKSLSNSFIKNNPQIPYKKIIGMRNIISHEYDKIDKSVVWDTCKNDIPELKKTILENLKRYSRKK